MQQISSGSGLHGSQGQGSASSQSTRSVGDPPQISRAISSRSKKRERSDPICDPVKLHRTEKGRRCGEESNSPEASSLVGKDGGISSVASVDRLVCIMQYEWNDSAERQLELIVSRTMLAKVVATTSDCDCLMKFLKLGGLSILDKWLQEAHRGKHFANKDISEDGSKAVEDLLLTLLAALERLPVDLVALKTCHVGKSVNLLRNHKHFDIQRRSKKLVDSWKRRVESEMKRSVEGRLPIDPVLSIHQQENAVIASRAQQVYYSEHPTSHANLSGGRGKFASVASLCSLEEGQLKTPSTVMTTPSLVDSSEDTARKVAFSSLVLSRRDKGEFPESPRLCSLPGDDGRAKPTMEVAFARLPSDQVKGSKSTGTPRNRRSPNASNSKTSSITAALSGPIGLSGPANASKDSSSSGSRELYEFAVQSGVTLPCCSSSQANPLTSVYDGHSRTSFNSFSSCATDCNNRSSVQACMCSEPGKAGIQLLANIAASEGSMVDKGSDSPSNRSISMHRASTIPVEGNFPLGASMKYYSQPIPKATNRVQDGEHFDQISSNVSSPSETSAHVDVRVCESKRALAVSAAMHSSYDTTPETNVLYTLARKDRVRECDKETCVPVEPGTTQVMNENMKAVSLQPALEDEAVGESNSFDRIKSKDATKVLSGTVLERSIAIGGLHKTSPPRQIYFKGTRQTAVAVPHDFEGIAPVKEVTDRPVFDLNEVVISEDTANLAVAASSSVFTIPSYAVPLPGSKPPLPVTPMAPIAVVAASKGSFTLPTTPYLPKGEIGWKGSAPTSAFRPTQPRNYPQKPNPNPAEQGANGKVVMDFDLNVAADSGFTDHDMGFTAAASLISSQSTIAPSFGRSGLSLKACGPPGPAWDLNQVDEGVAESQARPDFDLNSGPVSQDNVDDVLSSKHHGNRAPFISDVTNSGAANRMPSHPLHSVTPIMMPAFAMNNSDFSYPLGAGSSWPNSAPHEGMLQYNVLLQNQPGMTCELLPSMPTGSYGGIPFGFSPASMQSLSAPFMDTLCGPHTAPLARPSTSNGEPSSLLPSQTNKPAPFMMGILAEAIQHQGKGGFWSRSNLDLNAGPDGIDVKIAKDDRRQMLLLNEQMRARHQAMDMAAVLKQREQEGCLSMPGSMQGDILKQPGWR